MKHLFNISNTLKKLLIIVLASLFLNACGRGDNIYITGDTCSTEQQCEQCKKEGRVCADIGNSYCLGCIMLEQLYDAVGDNIMKLHDEFSKASMAVIMVGFSIWLALRLLKFVSSMTEANVSEVWNEILRKAFVCLFCGILASSSESLRYVINTLIVPIYLAFLDLGIQILNLSLSSDSGASGQTIDVFGYNITIKNADLSCKLEGDAKITEKGFPSSIKETMSCTIRALTYYLSMGKEVAREILKAAHGHGTGFLGIILSLFVLAIFEIVKYCFVFYLVDTIFQMGIIILLLPIYIVSYAFGPTRKWATMGFKHTIISAAFLMCFSIIVATVLSAMIGLVQQNPEIFNPHPAEVAFRDVSIGFLCILLIAFLILGSMGVSQQLTSAVIGAKMSANFQKNLKAVAQATGKAILSAVGSVITWGLSMIPVSKFTLIRNTVNKVKSVQAKLKDLAGREE